MDHDHYYIRIPAEVIEKLQADAITEFLSSVEESARPDRPIVFFDMDGTLAEWRAAATYEDLFEKDYYRSLEPHMNVVEAARQLKAEGVKIASLSAYLAESKYALIEKYEWLDEHAHFIRKRLFCPDGKSKVDVVRERYGCFDAHFVLLDDYSKNLHTWAASGGTSIKLLNGVNGTKGTWKGPAISRAAPPDEIAGYIAGILGSILNGGGAE